MPNEFIVKNGLVVGGNVVTSGTITINGALAATQSWVTSQAYLTSASLSGYATQSYVTSAISSLIDAAPAALDTLNELAAALGDDANFSTTITNSIAAKLPLAGGTLTGALTGTSATFSGAVSVGNLRASITNTIGWTGQGGFESITDGNFRLYNEGRNTYGNLTLGAATLSGALTGTSATFNGDLTLTANSSYININRISTAADGLLIYKTAGANRWLLGAWGNTNNTFYLYSYGTGASVFSVDYSTGAATFSSTIASGGNINVGSQLTFTPNEARIISGSSTIAINNNANNTNLLLINNSTGNVGINTSSPAYKLDIAGTLRTTNSALLGDSTTVGNSSFAWGFPGTYYGQMQNVSSTVYGIGFGATPTTIGTTVLSYNTTGNVGIGTTSPGAKLTVAGPQDTTGDVLVFNIPESNQAANTDNLRIYNDYQAPNYNITDDLGGVLQIGTRGGSPYWSLNAKGGATFATSAGNVGIGTASPAQKLHVVGNAWINRPSNKVDNASCTELPSRVEFNNAFASGASGYTVFTYPTSSVFRIYGDYDGNIGGLQPDLQLGLGYLTVKNSGGTIGNIGIGTVSPSSKLEVQGAADTSIQAIFQSSSVGNAAYSGGIQLGNAAANQRSSIVHDSSGDNTLTFTSHYSSGSANKFIFAPGGTERVRFQQNGNVGIGMSPASNERFSVNAAEGIWALSAYRSGVQIGGIHLNDSILNIQGAGGSEVRLSTTGNATWNGDILATRAWVGSQGYLTSVSDIWVNTTGDTMTGTLSFAQPVGLSFANGQYIKDNNSGGLIIYSGAAVNITGTSVSVTGATTFSDRIQITSNGGTNPVLAIRQTNAGSQGYDFETEDVSVGRLDLYGVTSGGRVQMMTWIKASGSVGIGTLSPTQKLHVVGNQYITGTITVGASGNNSNVNFVRGDGSGVGGIGWRSDGTFYVGGHLDYGPTAGNRVRVYGFGELLSLGNSQAGDILNITTSGTVGIGTTSPTHLLSLSRATQAAAYQLNINNAGGISDGNFTGIRFSQDSNAATELGNIKLHYYSTGATDLSFGTRYSPTALYIQSGGNVGIGTTGPEAKLHIVSGSGQAGFLSRGTNGDTWFPYSNGQNYVRGVTNFDSGSVYFTGGNIGIGTTSPSHKLHIKSSSLNSYPLVVQRAANTNNIFYIYEDGSGNGTLTLENSGGGAAVSIKSDGTSYLNGGNVGIGTTDPTSQMSGTFGIGIYNALYPAVGFKNSTTAWLWYGQDSTFRMWNATFGDILTANTSGNIGIGTSSPGAKLHVVGKSIFENNMRIYPASESWAEGLSFIMPTTVNWGGLRWQRQRGNSDGNWYIGFTALDSTDDLVFGANNGGNQVDNIIRLTKAGNVGVGTGSPNAKLDVAGNTRFGSGSFNVSTDQSFGSVGQYNFRDAVAIWNPNSTSAPSTTAVMSIGSMTNGVSLVTTGQINASGGNSSNWNTAYSWGNHASASYATTSYVTTQINNLINGAPGVLDTLDELAAALGDDANFATTVTNSIAAKLPLAGGTMSGALNLANNDIQGVGSIYISDPGAGEGINWNSGNGWGIFECPDVFDNTAGNLQFALNATIRLMTLNTAGALWIAGALTEASSLKLKENIETSEGNLEKVVNLRPVTYNKIGSQTTELGLIAEEVAEVYPEFVQYDENGEPIGVNYSRLTAALIGAVKQLTKRIETLENNG